MRRTTFPFPATWDRDGLAAIGFIGFKPLVGIDTSDIPPDPGVYVVLRPDVDAPYTFLDRNPLGAYTLADLTNRWVAGTPIIYIGKANGAKGLKQRIRPYSKRSSSHSGGRSIWQLEDASELVVTWKPTPGLPPADVERDYLDEFKRVHGRQPFANVQ